MDLAIFFILLVIFGLISLVIEYFTGFNPYVSYSLICVITVIGSIIYIMTPSLSSPGNIDMMLLSIERLTNWMTNFLPGAIVGDAAGIVIGKFAKLI